MRFRVAPTPRVYSFSGWLLSMFSVSPTDVSFVISPVLVCLLSPRRQIGMLDLLHMYSLVRAMGQVR